MERGRDIIEKGHRKGCRKWRGKVLVSGIIDIEGESES